MLTTRLGVPRVRVVRSAAMTSRPPPARLSHETPEGAPRARASGKAATGSSTPQPLSRPSTPSPSRNKGKGRAGPAPGSPLRPPDADASLSSLLDEALSSPLDLTPKMSMPPSPPQLARPPRAHYPESSLPGLRPRLVSNVTRSRSGSTSSVSYTNAEDFLPYLRHRQRYVSSPVNGETSRAAYFENVQMEQETSGSRFPDLDPATGLPRSPQPPESEIDAESPARFRIQRTISELSAHAHGPQETSTVVPFIGQLPSIAMPNFPDFQPMLRQSLELGAAQRRAFSTTPWKPNWWSGSGTSKSNIDSMLSEEDQAPTKAQEQVKHQVKYRTPQNPLVFCHGLLGFDYLGPEGLPVLQISHWRGIKEVLALNGCDVYIARVPATGSIKERAETLNEQIARQFPGKTVNLVAHSMGGLDCRYLCSQIRPTEFDIGSLTTISTPHRGSPFADYVIDNVIGRDRLPQLLSVMESLNLPNSGDGAAFAALGTRAMREFNTEVIDREDIKYYSWGASFEPGLLDSFRWPHTVILAKEGPNDGLVSVYSAKWGEYRGTLLNVNHLDLVGWVNQMRNFFSSMTGKEVSFKPATFYLEISDFLAEQGF